MVLRLAAPLPSILGGFPCAQHIKNQGGREGRKQEEAVGGGTAEVGSVVGQEVEPWESPDLIIAAIGTECGDFSWMHSHMWAPCASLYSSK